MISWNEDVDRVGECVNVRLPKVSSAGVYPTEKDSCSCKDGDDANHSENRRRSDGIFRGEGPWRMKPSQPSFKYWARIGAIF